MPLQTLLLHGASVTDKSLCPVNTCGDFSFYVAFLLLFIHLLFLQMNHLPWPSHHSSPFMLFKLQFTVLPLQLPSWKNLTPLFTLLLPRPYWKDHFAVFVSLLIVQSTWKATSSVTVPKLYITYMSLLQTSLSNRQWRECVSQSFILKPLKFIRGIPLLAQPQFSTLPWMLSLPSGTDQAYLSQDTYHELLVQSFL
jgi:hypothetical protein